MNRLIGALARRVGSVSPRRADPQPTQAASDVDLSDAAFARATAAIRAGDPEPATTLALGALGRGRRSPALADAVYTILLEVERPDADVLAVRARAARQAGHLTPARDDASASLKLRPSGPTRTQLRFIEGELRALEPGWVPDVPAGSASDRRSGQPGTGGPASGRPVAGRILHLVSTSQPWATGGFAIRTHDVARSQVGAGLDVHVATPPGFPGPGTHVADEPLVDGVRYHRLSPTATRDLPADARIARIAAELADLARRLRPAAIQAAENADMSETTAQAALAVGRSLGIPVVLEVRGFREEAWIGTHGADPSERYHLARAADSAAWASASAVVTLGATMRREIEHRGVPAERIRIVPNAVDTDRFTPGPKDPVLAATLGIRPGDVVVGYVGSLTWYEDLPALVWAVQGVVDRGREVRLLIAGDGPAAPDIRAAARAAGLGDRLLLPGRVPHERIVEIERLIDVFVVARMDLPLTRMVTPIKPIEALAAGCALVVSDLPALTEVVTDGVTGRVVPAGDRATLVEALDALVGDPIARQRLGAAGAAWARSERSWAANGERYRALFAELGAV
jgi:glycosyltransferase involved in cell wall biosynthesis